MWTKAKKIKSEKPPELIASSEEATTKNTTNDKKDKVKAKEKIEEAKLGPKVKGKGKPVKKGTEAVEKGTEDVEGPEGLGSDEPPRAPRHRHRAKSARFLFFVSG